MDDLAKLEKMKEVINGLFIDLDLCEPVEKSWPAMISTEFKDHKTESPTSLVNVHKDIFIKRNQIIKYKILYDKMYTKSHYTTQRKLDFYLTDIIFNAIPKSKNYNLIFIGKGSPTVNNGLFFEYTFNLEKYDNYKKMIAISKVDLF